MEDEINSNNYKKSKQVICYSFLHCSKKNILDLAHPSSSPTPPVFFTFIKFPAPLIYRDLLSTLQYLYNLPSHLVPSLIRVLLLTVDKRTGKELVALILKKLRCESCENFLEDDIKLLE